MPSRIRVRWRIFALLFALTLAAYVQRTSVSVAGARMIPDLHISQLQLGWLETAFLVSYTALQIPSGLVGQKLGARAMLTLCGGIGVAATLAAPVLPAVTAGAVLFAGLLLSQLVLGAAQAPLFALLSGALERWFPSRDWALTQGLSSCGIGLGSAVAPAAIAALMVWVGWRAALAITAAPVLVLVLVALWWWDGRDTPRQHPSVRAEDLADLSVGGGDAASPSFRSGLRLLADRNLAALTASYLAMNVVFYLITYWSFLYLVQARHFTLLQGGLAASAPFLAGAVGAALGGVSGKRCTARFGACTGLRLTPFITLPLAGAMLIISVHTPSPLIAVVGLSLAYGLVEMNEASFWAASMEIGRTDAVAAGAVLNTGGNVGGIVATPLVAFLSGRGDWNTPFVMGAGFAVLAALLWLRVDCGRPVPSLRS